MQINDGLNILIVTPFPIEALGGVSTAVLELRREFSKSPHTAIILAPGTSHRPELVDERGVYQMYLRGLFVESAPIKGFAGFVILLPITLFRLWRFLRRLKIDVVLIQYPCPNMIYFALLRRLSRWKLVLTFQGNDAHDLHKLRIVNRYFIRSMLSASDYVTCVADSLLKKVLNQFPGIHINANIVPNGARVTTDDVDLPKMVDSHEPSSGFVLTVCHLIQRKGIDTLIQAIEILKQKGRSIQVVAVGDGEERERFEAQAKGAGVADRLHLVGWKSHDEVLRYMRRCMFFVLASREEGFPLVIVEAMLLGKTVVATNVDGIPNVVIAGTTGLLVPPDDPNALATAMDTMLRDASFRGSLEAMAVKHATRNFTWKAIAAQYFDVFTKCVGIRHVLGRSEAILGEAPSERLA